MYKHISLLTFIACALLAYSSYGYAHSESERIDKLEKEVEQLKMIVGLMALGQASGEEAAGAEEATEEEPPEQWEDIANWRKLQTGMSYDAVRNILGEPHTLRGGSIATWEYKKSFKRGSVGFFDHKLNRWNEP